MNYLLKLWKKERSFILLIGGFLVVAFLAQPHPALAMWAGFLFAGYAAIANDSIQTIGTFIASNQDKKWWVLWLFLGGIFVATACYSFFGSDTADNKVLVALEDKEVADTLELLLKSGEEDGTRAVPDSELGPHLEKLDDHLEGLVLEARKDPEKTKLGHILDWKYRFEGVDKEEWVTDGRDGDVSHGRLLSKGFERTPTEIHFLQIAAPIILLILTRMRMPVSTTFILLTSFASSPAAVGKVLAKSFSGYLLAFLVAVLCYLVVSKISKKMFKGKAHFGWTIAQWVTSGTLWSVWLMQDMANIAVFLPRSLNSYEFLGFTGFIFLGLGILMYVKGGRIQTIVLEKSNVEDVRFATVIDFIYAILLFYFKLHSKVPMSTTWVFLGLLAGRELMMSLTKTGKNSVGRAFAISARDFGFAMIGLGISIAIAIGVNDQLSFSLMLENLPSEFANGFSKFFSKLPSWGG
jgi:hypothetical protein